MCIRDRDVLTPSINTPVRRLSGGNVQKVLVGREIAQEPSVLMTAYAVRGLDINTSYTIYNLLTAEKLKGVEMCIRDSSKQARRGMLSPLDLPPPQ